MYNTIGGFGATQRMVGPTNPEESLIFSDIDTETKRDLFDIYGLVIENDWYCYQITDRTIKGIISALMVDILQSGEPGQSKKAEFNFFNVFTIFVSNRKSEGEKEGNYNVSFAVGPLGTALIENDKKMTAPEQKLNIYEHFHVEYEDFDEKTNAALNYTYMQISRAICSELSTNTNLVIPDKLTYMVYAVTELFVTNIYRKLLYMLGEDPTRSLVSLNFNDLIEFHAQREFETDPETGEEVPGGVVLLMRPGVAAKLGIKNDESTEQEYEDY